MEQMLTDEYLGNFFSEEKIEETRKSILENADKYEEMMPGAASQLLEKAKDPAEWKKTMNQVKEQLYSLKAQKEAMEKNGGAGANNNSDNSNNSVDDVDEK